jgi:hypothetical protein
MEGSTKSTARNGILFPWAFYLSLIRNIEKKDTLTKKGGGGVHVYTVQVVTIIEAQE